MRPGTTPCWILLLVFLAVPHVTGAAAETPNILFIMADDLGYGDPGCYNPASRIPTPNVDRLAREGMRFTDAHAPAAVCVPTRYGLLTGRYPFRMGQQRRGDRIAPGRMTIASLLKENGYATGCVGKWHLGFENEKNPPADRPLGGGPVAHGFDYYFGIPASLDIPPYYYIENDRCVAPPTGEVKASSSPDWSPIQGAFWRAGGMAPGFRHEKVLPEFIDRSVAFLKGHAEKSPGKPFFLYVALASPHTPWLPGRAFEGKSRAGMYGDFVHQTDHGTGRLLDTLDELELGRKTLVFFTSDNGPVWYEEDAGKYGHRAAGRLRGMKGDAWEGGHRMPFIARWPGRVPAGAVSREVICHTDMLATFAAILGKTLPDDAGADSFDILPALLGEKSARPIRPATIFQSSGRVLSVRRGPWKLIPRLGSGGFSRPRRESPAPGGPPGQLYNMEEDLPESRNLYLEKPAVVRELTELLERYQKEPRTRPVAAPASK